MHLPSVVPSTLLYCLLLYSVFRFRHWPGIEWLMGAPRRSHGYSGALAAEGHGDGVAKSAVRLVALGLVFSPMVLYAMTGLVQSNATAVALITLLVAALPFAVWAGILAAQPAKHFASVAGIGVVVIAATALLVALVPRAAAGMAALVVAQSALAMVALYALRKELALNAILGD